MGIIMMTNGKLWMMKDKDNWGYTGFMYVFLKCEGEHRGAKIQNNCRRFSDDSGTSSSHRCHHPLIICPEILAEILTFDTLTLKK